MAAAKHIDFLNVTLCNVYYVFWFFNSKSMSTNTKSNWSSAVELRRIFCRTAKKRDVFFPFISCRNSVRGRRTVFWHRSRAFLPSPGPLRGRPLYDSVVSFSIPQTIMEIIIVRRIMHTRVIYRTRTYINLVSAVSIARADTILCIEFERRQSNTQYSRGMFYSNCFHRLVNDSNDILFVGK